MEATMPAGETESWTFDGVATGDQDQVVFAYHASLVRDATSGDYSLSFSNLSHGGATRYFVIPAESADAAVFDYVLSSQRPQQEPADR